MDHYNYVGIMVVGFGSGPTEKGWNNDAFPLSFLFSTIAEHRPKYSGFYHGIKSVYSESGLSGLYRVCMQVSLVKSDL